MELSGGEDEMSNAERLRFVCCPNEFMPLVTYARWPGIGRCGRKAAPRQTIRENNANHQSVDVCTTHEMETAALGQVQEAGKVRGVEVQTLGPKNFFDCQKRKITYKDLQTGQFVSSFRNYWPNHFKPILWLSKISCWFKKISKWPILFAKNFAVC